MKRKLLLVIFIVLISIDLSLSLDLKIDDVVIRSNSAAISSGRIIVDVPYESPAKHVFIPLYFKGLDGSYLDVKFSVPSDIPIADPLKQIAPANLISYGKFNSSIGGLPGTVIYWIEKDKYSSGIEKMTIIGEAFDNNTQIVTSSESILNRASTVSHNLAIFNESLNNIELHYLR